MYEVTITYSVEFPAYTENGEITYTKVADMDTAIHLIGRFANEHRVCTIHSATIWRKPDNVPVVPVEEGVSDDAF